MAHYWGGAYAATGSLMDECDAVGATDSATKNAT